MTNANTPQENEIQEQLRQLATAVGDACFAAAVTAYENARIDGLCHDGAWECALQAVQTVNLESVTTQIISKHKPS